MEKIRVTAANTPRWEEALEALWALNRVHCGPEMRSAYRKLSTIYPNTEIFGYASGERCGTWIAPPAWLVDHATLTDPNGNVVADWSQHSLHLFTFSPPFSGLVTRQDLDSHLLSIPEKPDRIPFHFRNQYRHWEADWGFCLSEKVRDTLPDGKYRVEISTRFESGVMEMAEQVHKGELTDSLLLVGHFDHPNMCNDGLVGCLAGHEAISRLNGRRTQLTYRMLSTVEIIGSAFYAEHRAKQNNVREAMFVASAGADAPLAYQKSFSGSSVMDRVMRHVFESGEHSASLHSFRQGPLGNDETAFDVGGVGIPCGSVMRAPFAAYHTDADTPDSVDNKKFEQMVEILERAINVLERNAVVKRKFSGLPCLSAPELGLYLSPNRMSGIDQDVETGVIMNDLPEHLRDIVLRRANSLNYLMNIIPVMSEGNYTTLDIAEKAVLPFEFVDAYTNLWVEKDLMTKTWFNPFSDDK